MFSSIKKWLVKKFLPTSDSLSDTIAAEIAKFINSQNISVQNKIISYDEYAAKLSMTANLLTNCLKDGKIDEEETKQISQHIQPIVEKVLEMVKEKI